MSAKAIMIQGTMSNAGKSLLCAGLCRIFSRDGYKVAPFKAQNMALNSYITRDGLEIGRAQAVQAFAAGVEPSGDMNPVLLKPTTDMGSQVIVNGRALKNMSAKEYYSRKKELIPDVTKAYERLASENDIIVIEGAGSPAEINLAKDDFVNMGMAKIANCPVLLAGDIDRGGVFAQLYGTISLLDDEAQNRIQGLIINKFRGDVSILEPGLEQLEVLCKKKVVGVVPYMKVDIEEEDSVSDRLYKSNSIDQNCIKIGVIKLPRISNYTDFMPLEIEDDVRVYYISDKSMLDEMDLIIIPGSKSTISDLNWMKESGIAPKITRLAAGGKLVLGICGGYQMLGEALTDGDHVESEDDGLVQGLNLLPIKTVFEQGKHQKQVQLNTGELSGEFSELSNRIISGYEIHNGCSDRNIASKGSVLGTYVHGLFEDPGFREAFLEIIASKKGIVRGANPAISYDEYREQQFDVLEGCLRDSLDIDQIYRIINEWR